MRGVIKVGGSIGLVFSCYLFFRLTYHVTTKESISFGKKIEVINDPLLSEIAYQEIFQEIAHLSDHPQGLLSIVDEVRKKCPYLRRGICNMRGKNDIVTQWFALRPELLINNSHILLESGDIVTKNYFTQEALEGVHNFFCSSEMFKLFLSNKQTAAKFFLLKPEIYAQYEIYYNRPDEIWFIDKKNYIQIKSSEERLLDQATAHACTQITQTLKRSPAHRQKWIIADIRFKDQIIVSRGGGNHEGGAIF